jgi:phosphate transport system protein
MSVHLRIDLSDLHKDLLSMCASVEDMIHRAVGLLSQPDIELARQLIQQDNEIDQWDVRIEDSCLKILALHQPVAIDLRRITVVMKISAELERVADLAVNIAERSLGLLDGPESTVPELLREMSQRAVDMLHGSIDAYVDLNSARARQIVREDDFVDETNRELINSLIRQMHEHPDRLDALLNLFSAVRQVERVADHASNIAEDVVYLVEGRIIRHATHLDKPQEARAKS